MDNELLELYGSVESVTFHRADTGFTVLQMACDEKLITVVGVMPEIHEGEELKLTGYWDSHPQFGEQFRAELCEKSLPSSAAAILKYLSSGVIKGIGPVTAAKIVETFGEQTLDIIENDPGRLATIKSISRSKADKIGEEYKKQFSIREVMLFLGNYGMTVSECLRTYKKYGTLASEIVKSNPYMLCSEGIDISFDRADEIAQSMSKPKDSPERIKAGIQYICRHNLGNGHTCIPKRKIMTPSLSLLEVSSEDIELYLETLIQSEQLKMENINGEDFLFLPYVYRAEKKAAARINISLRFTPDLIDSVDEQISLAEKDLNITYSKIQKEAIKMSISNGLFILTGGPGTGKTTALNGIIHIFEKNRVKTLLAAPTGRAAKRMSEVTGKEAKTLHRLLEVEWTDQHTPVFAKNEQNPLDADAVIVDELSMVDILLFSSLMEALPLGCRLILVGDSDQLPPVGAGNVLHDLTDYGLIPIIHLKEIFRQAMESLIVSNAHKIVRGETPELSIKNNDFFFLSRSPSETVSSITDLYARRLPKSYGFSPLTDIQALCPSRKGETGSVNINKSLQDILNPPDKLKREYKNGFVTLREGDKVMQSKNNYDLMWTRDDDTQGNGVFNGDVGVLKSIDPKASTAIVRYDDRNALYSFESLEELELAYAITVHKSQGSEFDAVIMPCSNIPSLLCYRNLLYTAVTRAKKLMIIVGNKNTLIKMVKNDKKTKRYSALNHFLTQMTETN